MKIPSPITNSNIPWSLQRINPMKIRIQKINTTPIQETKRNRNNPPNKNIFQILILYLSNNHLFKNAQEKSLWIVQANINQWKKKNKQFQPNKQFQKKMKATEGILWKGIKMRKLSPPESLIPTKIILKKVKLSNIESYIQTRLLLIDLKQLNNILKISFPSILPNVLSLSIYCQFSPSI